MAKLPAMVAMTVVAIAMKALPTTRPPAAALAQPALGQDTALPTGSKTKTVVSAVALAETPRTARRRPWSGLAGVPCRAATRAATASPLSGPVGPVSKTSDGPGMAVGTVGTAKCARASR